MTDLDQWPSEPPGHLNLPETPINLNKSEAKRGLILISTLGDLAAAQRFLRSYPKIKLRPENGALDAVARLGHLMVVRWLLEVFPKLLDEIDFLTFLSVCAHGHLPVAQWMLPLLPGIDFSQDKDALFYKVCECGQVDTAKWILSIYPQHCPPRQIGQRHPNRGRIIRIEGTDPNRIAKINANNMSLLLEYMCQGGHFPMVRWICSICPAIRVDDHAEEVLFYACYQGRIEDVRWIMQICPKTDLFCDDNSPFRAACEEGHLETAQYLRSIRPKLDVRAGDDRVFRFASQKGQLHVLQWLVEICPEIDMSARGNRPFILACGHGHLPTAQWLLEVCLKIDLVEMRNAFLRAAGYSHSDVLKWIHSVCPEVLDRETINGAFPCVCGLRSIALVEWFVSICPPGSIKVNASLLANVAYHESYDVFQWLLDHFCEIDLYRNNHRLLRRARTDEYLSEIIASLVAYTATHPSIRYIYHKRVCYVIGDRVPKTRRYTIDGVMVCALAKTTRRRAKEALAQIAPRAKSARSAVLLE